jgi:hypothetical protein
MSHRHKEAATERMCRLSNSVKFSLHRKRSVSYAHKSKVFPIHTKMEKKGIAPPILSLSIIQRKVVNFMPQLLYAWEETPLPIA